MVMQYTSGEVLMSYINADILFQDKVERFLRFEKDLEVMMLYFR